MSKENETLDKAQNGNDFIANVRQLYLVSDVIFVEIKNGKITDRRGLEISTDFIIEREHFLGNGWGYVIL